MGFQRKVRPEDFTTELSTEDFDKMVEATVPKTKRPMGRPRRGKLAAKDKSVWIDDVAAEVLRKEFGSLGNALYYIYRGIQDFKARACLVSNSIAEAQEQVHDAERLTFEELETIRRVIQDRIDRHRGPDSELMPILRALRKLERTLLGGAGRPY